MRFPESQWGDPQRDRLNLPWAGLGYFLTSPEGGAGLAQFSALPHCVRMAPLAVALSLVFLVCAKSIFPCLRQARGPRHQMLRELGDCHLC